MGQPGAVQRQLSRANLLVAILHHGLPNPASEKLRLTRSSAPYLSIAIAASVQTLCGGLDFPLDMGRALSRFVFFEILFQEEIQKCTDRANRCELTNVGPSGRNRGADNIRRQLKLQT